MAAFITWLEPRFWIACLVWLVIAFWRNAPRSGRSAMTMWVVMGVAMDSLIPLLHFLDESLQRHLWYLCWMVINSLTVIAIGAWHLQHHLQPDHLAKTVSYTALAMIAVQLTRYTDRMAVQTDLLGPVYQVLVPAMNIGVLLYAIGWLYRELKHEEANGC